MSWNNIEFYDYRNIFKSREGINAQILAALKDYYHDIIPINLHGIFRWAEYFWHASGIYKMSMSRVSRYFITEIMIEGDIDRNEKKKYLEILNDQLNIRTFLSLLGDDFCCYGNAFVSVYKPFQRYLICPQCKTEYNINTFTYNFRDGKFYATCPKCKFQGEMVLRDVNIDDIERLNLKRWSIYDISIRYSYFSDNCEYYFDPPEFISDEINNNNKLMLHETPAEFLEVLFDKNKKFKFDSDEILHLKEETISGIRTMGWGIPRIMCHLGDVFYVQILRKYNQALALDYIVPIRIIHPAPVAGAPQPDPLSAMNAGSIVSHIQNIIQKHRADPTHWHVSPFPIAYTPLSGEGLRATTAPLIEQAIDMLLTSLGIPVEFYKGTLQFQAAPNALRLFEQLWNHLYFQYNKFLTWLGQKLATYFHWEKGIRIKLQKLTYADSMEKKQIMLSLMGAGVISRETALKPWGIDVVEEIRKIIDEQRESQELQQEAEREIAQKVNLEEAATPPPVMQQTGLVPGLMGIQGKGTIPPDQLTAIADQLAQQLVFNTPPTLVRSQLAEIKKYNEALYALVKQKMQEIRQQAETQGKAMIIEQQRQMGR